MAASSDDELPSYDVVKHQQFSIPDSAISVKLSESVDWTLDVSKTDSIFDVKRRIQARNGVNPARQVLCTEADGELDNERSVESYNLNPITPVTFSVSLDGVSTTRRHDEHCMTCAFLSCAC
eukprot:m.129480 g.129480  ORF g.129480 m.129480 type:complete len:122 (+) comp16761_c1_seq7:516-881(+)